MCNYRVIIVIDNADQSSTRMQINSIVDYFEFIVELSYSSRVYYNTIEVRLKL